MVRTSPLWLLGFLLALGGCLKKPEPPVWEIELNLPILADTLTIRELVDSVDALTVVENDPDSTVLLHMEFGTDTLFDTLYLLDTLAFAPFTDTLPLPLASLYLTDLPDTAMQIYLISLVPGIPPTPSPVVIPAFQDTLYRVLDMPDLDYALVFGGTFHLQVHNGFPVPLRELRVVVTDDSISQPVAELVFQNIPAGGVGSDLDTIVSPLLSGRFRFEIRIASPGSGGAPVQASALDSLTLTLWLDSLRVLEAVIRNARLYGAISDSGVIATPSVHAVVDTLVFSAGQVTAGLINPFPFPATGRIRIREMGLDTLLTAPPRGEASLPLPLPDYIYINTDPDSTRIHATASLEVPLTSPTYDTVRALEPLYIWFDIRGIQFERVHLAFPEPLARDLPPITQELNLPIPPGASSLEFPDLLLSVDVISAVGLHLQYSFHLLARNRDTGEERTMLLTGEIPPGTPTAPITFPITLTGLSPILAILPQEITFTGSVALIGSGSLHRTSFVTLGKTLLETPLRVVFHRDTLFLDTTRIPLEDVPVLSERETELLRVARLTSRFTNALPVGLSGKLDLFGYRGNRISDRLSFPFTIAPGQTNERGVVIAPDTSTVADSILGSDLEIFGTDSLFGTAEIYFPETDTLAVTIRDFIGLTSFATIRALIDIQRMAGGQP